MNKENENVIYQNGEGGYIFISHSHHDINQVRIIRNVLEDNGYEPLCFFLKCLTDNDEVEGLIKREIDSRDIFLYIESPNSLKSDWVKKERAYIDGCKNKTIFTISLNENTDVRKETLKILDKTRVFISYSKRDEWAYSLVKNRLIEKDLKVFDFNDLEVGMDVEETIKAQIDQACQCGCFLILLSKNGLRSQWVMKEISYAYKTNKDRIFVALIDDVDFAKAPFSECHILATNSWPVLRSNGYNEQALNEIAENVKKILSK